MPWVVPVLTSLAMVTAIGTGIYSATRSTPKPPALPPVTEPPVDTAAQQAAYAEAESLRKRRGAASTILTGPSGVTSTPTTMKTRLGD